MVVIGPNHATTPPICAQDCNYCFFLEKEGAAFTLRGLLKVSLEWTLVTLAYNLKRLHKLGADFKTA
ncbi:hypothetical protein [Synoicihabitans lomoniglobus]|uniref:Transposase DDE domain-containing protein n=1 Tax=Synoicihabitans lomoniglobus TaxID=2909285 RepID=A0AAF0CT21_9BACT|nr:hypothetical protein [Opitutaceae bacterium LMO-M01]WED67525.1 hypothetical protein PXH66_17125 [Opitutaceae bacterium LMO-M01]